MGTGALTRAPRPARLCRSTDLNSLEPRNLACARTAASSASSPVSVSDKAWFELAASATLLPPLYEDWYRGFLLGIFVDLGRSLAERRFHHGETRRHREKAVTDLHGFTRIKREKKGLSVLLRGSPRPEFALAFVRDPVPPRGEGLLGQNPTNTGSGSSRMPHVCSTRP